MSQCQRTSKTRTFSFVIVTKMTSAHHFLIYLFILTPAIAQFEGDRCRLKETGEKGKCVLLDDCDYAKKLLKSSVRPQHCGFKGRTSIVCCPQSLNLRIGQKSEKRCEKYYPKPQGLRPLVFGGNKSLAQEFPHMAILGYGDKDNIRWLCGGSLISEQFVLTAAHCVLSLDHGVVRWVRLGDLDILDEKDDAKPQNFDVIQTFIHPKYKSPSHYHDIALLKLNKPAQFNDYVKPACLYTNMTVSEPLIATGWGLLDFLGEPSTHLMKVTLDQVDFGACSRSYSTVSSRKLNRGIVDNWQVCAGGEDGRDTCPGDSGGSLQLKKSNPVHYYVVGVTSFGKACGVANSVGVYTRVAQYVDWIEDVM